MKWFHVIVGDRRICKIHPISQKWMITIKRYSILWHCDCQFLFNFDNSFINSNSFGGQ
jgi:hypothetical protein